MKKLLLFSFIIISSKIYSQPCKTVIGYYPGWQWYDRSNLVRPATIDYSKYSIINYSFLIPQADGSINTSDPWGDKNLLLGTINWNVAPAGYDTGYDLGNSAYHNPGTSLISYAHANDVKVMISLGGWTQSGLFPSISANPALRTNFAHWCNEIIRVYQCDGIDMDWEYPGFADNGGSPADTDNFTFLLQEIRDSLDLLENQSGNALMLTSAFSANASRMNDIDWNQVVPLLDYVNLMSYDFFGAWDANTNHNSPLYPGLQGDPLFCLSEGVDMLINDHNVPSEKINAGVAFYGRSSVTTDDAALYANCAGYADAATFGAEEGTPSYYNVVAQSGLFEYHWDDVAKVPYLTGNNGLHTFVSYDDEQSIQEKAQFIIDNDLAGAIIWEITGDYMETSSGSGIVADTPLATALNTGLCGLAVEPLDCENMCVTGIAMSSQSGMVDITIQNGNMQINYPIVMIILNGDTVANIDEEFFFFAQLDNQSVTHTVATTLTSIPTGFACTVVVIDYSTGASCDLQYPCIPDQVSTLDQPSTMLFPNPFRDELKVSSKELVDSFTLNDGTGKVVKCGNPKSKSFQVDTRNLASGVYLMELKYSDGTQFFLKVNKENASINAQNA